MPVAGDRPFGSHAAMRTLLVAVGLSTIALGPCSKDAATTSPVAPPSAQPPASASASASGLAEVADPIVDLFHTVDCTVAVSSKVDNPKDFPEHLVDGKKETAWNGKTGDLTGFVLFRVPKSARVLKVEITPGFDKIAKDGGDLFTMNHRITKVRLSREGKAIKEVDLDPNKRDLQAIAIDEPGGDFKLEVLATLPGTKKEWKELAVSELRVWGRAGGAPPNPTHIPKTAIGNLDGVPPHVVPKRRDYSPGPYASVAELCRAWDAMITPAMKERGDRYPGFIEPPYCQGGGGTRGVPESAFAQGPFKGGQIVVLVGPESEAAYLALRTEKGWAKTDVSLWSRSVADPGCLHGTNHRFEDAALQKTSTGQEVLVVRVLHKEIWWAQMEADQNGASTWETGYACRVDAAGLATCDRPVELARAKTELPDAFDPSNERAYDIDVAKTPWKSRKKPVIGPAGDLRLE